MNEAPFTEALPPYTPLAYGVADDSRRFQRIVFRALAIVGLLVGIERLCIAWFLSSSLAPLAYLFASNNRRGAFPSAWQQWSGAALCLSFIVFGVLLSSASIRMFFNPARGFRLMRWGELLALATALGWFAFTMGNPLRGTYMYSLYLIVAGVTFLTFPLMTTLLFTLRFDE